MTKSAVKTRRWPYRGGHMMFMNSSQPAFKQANELTTAFFLDILKSDLLAGER